MEKIENGSGGCKFVGATESTTFCGNDFCEVGMGVCSDDNQQWALHTNMGSLTVLDRMTGFGWRDVETGYRAPNGDFWLASGNVDVMGSGAETLGDAIQWVKDRANTCVPKSTSKAGSE